MKHKVGKRSRHRGTKIVPEHMLGKTMHKRSRKRSRRK